MKHLNRALSNVTLPLVNEALLAQLLRLDLEKAATLPPRPFRPMTMDPRGRGGGGPARR